MSLQINKQQKFINIAIGIITYQRPVGLTTLLKSLSHQVLSFDLIYFRWFVIIVDNDINSQQQIIIDQARLAYGMDIRYCQENRRGIPIARNTCVKEALAYQCDALIFVDDDEITPPGWLEALLSMWKETKGDIITGPVKGILPKNSPAWAVKSQAYTRVNDIEHGKIVSCAWTNNTLISKTVLNDLKDSFHMIFRFSGSEDRHYFTRAVHKGYKILWCPHALIYETIPFSRVNYRWLLKRGFRIGAGYSISHLLIKPKASTILHLIYISLYRLGIGIGQLFVFPITGWYGLIAGSQNIAASIGSILGIFRINYQEYQQTHGE